tara:strand:+ start:89 stop:400 length:312 start_codon:yes stop_codon:yes gene_type:complete
MVNKYIIEIDGEDNNYSFQLEIKDPKLRELYDHDPNFFQESLDSKVHVAISDMFLSEYPPLRLAIAQINLDASEEKEKVVQSLLKELRSKTKLRVVKIDPDSQ